jgi:hypothetical protein
MNSHQVLSLAKRREVLTDTLHNTDTVLSWLGRGGEEKSEEFITKHVQHLTAKTW